MQGHWIHGCFTSLNTVNDHSFWIHFYSVQLWNCYCKFYYSFDVCCGCFSLQWDKKKNTWPPTQLPQKPPPKRDHRPAIQQKTIAVRAKDSRATMATRNYGVAGARKIPEFHGGRTKIGHWFVKKHAQFTPSPKTRTFMTRDTTARPNNISRTTLLIFIEAFFFPLWKYQAHV